MIVAQPWILLGLVVPVLLAAWEWARRGHPVRLPVDHTTAGGGGIAGAVRAANLLPAVLLALAVVLAAGPQRLGVPERERALTNIELCVDVSGSMTAAFGDGSRYDAAMAALGEFCQRRRGDAFGLTIFGSEVLRWTPLTQDLAVLRQATPWLRPEDLPPHFGGTMIAKALHAALATVRDQAAEGGDRMIVLLSDGQSADFDAATAGDLSRELARERIVFFMVHIGEEAPQGELYTIAAATGGRVFAVGDPAGLRECFARIDALRPVRLKPRAPQPVDHRWPWALAGLAALGLRALALLGLRWVPW